MAKSINSNDCKKEKSLLKSKTPIPIYGSGNCLYSTTDYLSPDDINNYFSIVPHRTNSSLNSSEKCQEKTIEYLRPISFEQQQIERQKFQKNPIEMISYPTFHEKFDLKIII